MKVKMSRQMGRSKQWGFGSLFYFKDGCKDRISTKALKVAVLFPVIPFVLFSSMKNDIKLSGVEGKAFSMKTYNVSSSLPDEIVGGEKKKSHLKARKQAKFEPLVVTKRPVAELEVAPGTYVKAVLITGASDGPVKVRLLEDVKAGGRTVVPLDSVLIGKGSSTEERLMIDFNKIVLLDGQAIGTNAVACDPSDQMPGLFGSNVNSRALNLAGAFGLNFAAGYSTGSEEDTKDQSIRQKIQSGAALAALEEAKRLSEKAKNTKPRIEIKRNQKLLILFTGS